MACHTLVAGFGNVLRGDDGFGVEVLRHIAADAELAAAVDLVDVGTGGIRLVQALMDGYARLIIIDAATRGLPPGTVSAFGVESLPAASDVDMHTAVPVQALGLAAALGALPREVLMVACEPERLNDLTLELSPAVRAAIGDAVERVRALVLPAAPPLTTRRSGAADEQAV